MRNKIVQISLFDTYNSVASSIENSNPELLTLLDEHINFNSFIPIYSRQCFYKNVDRRHKYHLESFVRALVIQKLFGFDSDKSFLTTLKICKELRKFCGFTSS